MRRLGNPREGSGEEIERRPIEEEEEEVKVRFPFSSSTALQWVFSWDSKMKTPNPSHLSGSAPVQK